MPTSIILTYIILNNDFVHISISHIENVVTWGIHMYIFDYGYKNASELNNRSDFPVAL